MNKLDLFQDKISHSGRHLRLYLPQFKGGPDVCSVTMSSFNIVCDEKAEFLVEDRPPHPHPTTSKQIQYKC